VILVPNAAQCKHRDPNVVQHCDPTMGAASCGQMDGQTQQAHQVFLTYARA
jgi:hypothetical protein